MANVIRRRLLGLLLIAFGFSQAPGSTGSPSQFPVVSRYLPTGGAPARLNEVQHLLFGGRVSRDGGEVPTLRSNRPFSLFKQRGVNSHSSSSQTLFRPIQVVDEAWDEFGAAWTNVTKLDHVYDSLGRERERTGWMGFMNFWDPLYNALFSYDQNDRVTAVVTRIWNGASWQTNTRDSIVYDQYGNPVEETVAIYNGSGWDPLQRYLVSYDASLRLTELVVQSWISSKWTNSTRYALQYDAMGLLTELLTQNWTAGAWTNAGRESYAYDAGERQTGRLVEYYSGGVWNYDYRVTWTYDGSGYLVEELLENWKSSAWTPDELTKYTNDGQGLPGDILTQYWNGFDWIDETIAYRSYDEDRIVEEFTQRWTGTEWVNFHKTSTAWQMYVTSPTITRFYPVSDKWNIVSVPLLVADYSTTVVFPAGVSSAFAFDAGYVASPTLESGKGYWLKFDGAQNVPVTGELLTADTITVAAGWNIVGSIGVPVPVVNISTIPGGLVSSSFFGFNAGYEAATVLVPGKGYWVKMAEAGQLVLGGPGNVPAAARIQIGLDDADPPAPPGVEDAGVALPADYELGQNYPNPFNPATTIGYALPTEGHVRLSVFNVLGQEVAVLVDGWEAAGSRSVTFDARSVPSGVYTYRITAGNFTATGKMLLVR